MFFINMIQFMMSTRYIAFGVNFQLLCVWWNGGSILTKITTFLYNKNINMREKRYASNMCLQAKDF